MASDSFSSLLAGAEMDVPQFFRRAWAVWGANVRTWSATPGVAAHKDPALDRRRNAHDCLLEVLLMARCAGIVCTLSNVSVAAVFLAPEGYRHYLFCRSEHVSHEELSDSELAMY